MNFGEGGYVLDDREFSEARPSLLVVAIDDRRLLIGNALADAGFSRETAEGASRAVAALLWELSRELAERGSRDVSSGPSRGPADARSSAGLALDQVRLTRFLRDLERIGRGLRDELSAGLVKEFK